MFQASKEARRIFTNDDGMVEVRHPMSIATGAHLEVESRSRFLDAAEVRALITALEPYAAPKPVPLSNADTKFYAHIFAILTQERRTSGHFGRRAADRVQPDHRTNCGRRASDCSRGGNHA